MSPYSPNIQPKQWRHRSSVVRAFSNVTASISKAISPRAADARSDMSTTLFTNVDPWISTNTKSSPNSCSSKADHFVSFRLSSSDYTTHRTESPRVHGESFSQTSFSSYRIQRTPSTTSTTPTSQSLPGTQLSTPRLTTLHMPTCSCTFHTNLYSHDCPTTPSTLSYTLHNTDHHLSATLPSPAETLASNHFYASRILDSLFTSRHSYPDELHDVLERIAETLHLSMSEMHWSINRSRSAGSASNDGRVNSCSESDSCYETHGWDGASTGRDESRSSGVSTDTFSRTFRLVIHDKIDVAMQDLRDVPRAQRTFERPLRKAQGISMAWKFAVYKAQECLFEWQQRKVSRRDSGFRTFRISPFRVSARMIAGCGHWRDIPQKLKFAKEGNCVRSVERMEID